MRNRLYAIVWGNGITLILQRAMLIDGVTSEVRRDMTVVIRDGRFESVSGEVTSPQRDATVIDLQNRWLLRGLVDAHVHVRDLESARAALSSVIAGSDMPYDGTSALRIADEIAELGRRGMAAMAAIKSATSAAAACLGIDRRTGAVTPGLEADLIVVDRDPIMDLRALGSPVLVINDGRVAVNSIRQ